MNAVRLSRISVRFGAVQALDAVDLEVQQGSLHAVVGENGAGKTTLMRVLYGAQRPASGEVALFGQPVALRSSAEAIRAGVGMVSQHYAILPELTCLQNLILGAEGGPLLGLRAAEARAEQLAQKMGFEFSWSAPAESLSPAAAQKLEILKLLWRESRILILDEPTAMLSPADSDALFASLRRLVAEGATVLLVTHRIAEVLEHCARVTVLRAGRKVAEMDVAETDARRLAADIVGHDPSTPPSERAGVAGEVRLRARGLTVLGERRNRAVDGVDFELRSGEVVGLAGVDGSGQRELVQALVGVRGFTGSLEGFGTSWAGISTARRLEQGLRVIPEDRHREAVIEDWSLEENGALGFQRRAELAARGLVNGRARAELGDRVLARFGAKAEGRMATMRSLSGGNQQRVVAARALEFGPRLLVAFQPARGLDIEATARLYAGLRRAAAEGAAVLVVAFDLDELLAHCDRLLVMCGGRMREAPGLDREAVGQLMVGTG